MNSIFGYKDIYRWSFYSNLGYKRRLDYILCEWFVKRFCSNCRVYRSISDGFDSDHKVVVMNCAFPSRKTRKEIFQKKEVSTSCNVKLLKRDQTIMEQYSVALENRINIANDTVDINKLSDEITTAIQKSSDIVIPKHSKAKENKPWVDENFLQLIEARVK